MEKIKAFLKHPILWCFILMGICLYVFSLCIQATVDDIKDAGGLKNIIQPLWDGKQKDADKPCGE